MEYDAEIRSLSLSSLPGSSRRLLSDLLNSQKVLSVEDPIKLPRDWHGLASLVNISSEVSASLEKHGDPTGKVIEIWQQDPTANVGLLLQYLETLDRFDVYDDLIYDLRLAAKNGGLKKKNGVNGVNGLNELLTFDDRPGYKHMYDAFVLYATQDAAFVKEIKAKLNEFEICGKDVLLPGHATEYAPVIKLMTERCRYIIIVYSPEFLDSRDNIYYRDYAQAVSVKSSLNLVPIMYRQCSELLPAHMKFYFWLHYGSDMYDFWDKLRKSLHPSRTMPVEPLPYSNSDGIIKKLEDLSQPNKIIIPSKENSPTTSVRSLDTMSTAIINSIAITENVDLNQIIEGQNGINLSNNVLKPKDIISLKEDIQEEPLKKPKKKKSVFKIFVKPFERKSKKKMKVAVEEIIM